jgi:Fic family protein
VWEWYDKRDWRLSLFAREKKSKETIMATRLEHIKKVNQNRSNKVKIAINTVLGDMFVQDQIKYKNGNYKISAIAELTGISRQAVSKYLKEMERLTND